MSRPQSRMPAEPARRGSQGRTVSLGNDPAERQADRAADVVSRGGSVSGWSFSAVPTNATSAGVLHRQDDGTPKTDEDKKEEPLPKAVEAALETPQGKALTEKVLDDPVVKKVRAAVTTPLGIGLAAGGVSALAATRTALPVQLPAIPLDRITPGLSAEVILKGSEFTGLTLKYEEQGTKKKAGPTDTERSRAETARLSAEAAKFRAGMRFMPGSKEDLDQKAEQEAIARYVASRSSLPGIGRPLIPLIPGGTVKTAPPSGEQEQKKKDEAPVQREPASSETAAPAGFDTSRVDAAVRGPGRALDPSLRRPMEARFGYDFSVVRVHDDAPAAAAAGDVHAAAFTVGTDIVFAPGRFEPSSPGGRRLLAHELAHVVQQSSGRRQLARKAVSPLSVSSPADPAEREADEVAARVVAGMGAPAPGPATTPPPARVHRAGRDETEAGDDDLVLPDLEDDPWPDADSGPPGGVIQASGRGGPAVAPPGFARGVASAGDGTPLPGAHRRALEPSFGTSFAGVRVHRGHQSHRLAESIGAEAFTWGDHIHLADSAADPFTAAGLRLLAHELTHVRQQQSGGGQHGVVHRSRALYFSTLGRQGYFRYAERFDRDRGFPPPVRVSSVEEMLESLVTMPRPLESVRLVSHAVPAGVFLPLLRGGSTSLFAQDLRLQTQTAVEGELSSEHPTVRDQVHTVDRHVVPRDWVADAYARVAGEQAGRAFLRARRFPDAVAAGGDLEALLWWTLDRELVTAQRERRPGRGRARMAHLLGDIPAPMRASAVRSYERNIAIYRARATEHLLLRGYPARGAPDERRTQAAAAVAEFEARVTRVAGGLIDDRIAQGGQFGVQASTPRYESIQGALERGTYPNNLLFAKVAIPNGMPFDIRGCRIGQNMAWLEAFRDFWGLGAGPSRKRPDVSAPDLRHVFGLRRRASAEWLEAPRRGQILGGTPAFETHIVHAR